MPQGSCLGPVLFVMYISSLYDLISKHLPLVRGYADDHQLYISFRPDTKSTTAMEDCVSDIRRWMLTNRLMINDGKTEVMLVSTPQQLAKITLDGIKVGGENIVPATAVRNLGVNQDNHLKMDKHVSSLCSKSFYQLLRLRRIPGVSCAASYSEACAYIHYKQLSILQLFILWHASVPNR